MSDPIGASGRAERAALFLAESRSRIEGYLEKTLPNETESPAALHQAMRYSVFSGGKRLRPALAFASARACGADPDRVLAVAAACELIHTYALVHDDLPSMDDDGWRRGRPTVHVEFGEAVAILTGDALQAEAFAQLATAAVPVEVIASLARAVGSRGLVGGQADDLAFDPGAASLEGVESIHSRKTGALFGFAVGGAARTVGAGEGALESLGAFASHYGTAFQLVDDVLDRDREECSVLAVVSSEEARRLIGVRVVDAVRALEPLGADAAVLAALAEDLPGRLP